MVRYLNEKKPDSSLLIFQTLRIKSLSYESCFLYEILGVSHLLHKDKFYV
ncbi:Uncharacterized protein dnm_055920 [Desulfonema magnum]|uniref:Uncharacterized protein n=1 Tax=Desulfonema magnum TaxID=45655 RepID=A0A975BPX9_9BACT|nr:Uncharacterized protein dnm_055920 [Desulfonema magnum]